MVQWRVGDVWRWLRYSAPIELLGLPVFDLQPGRSPVSQPQELGGQ